MRDNLLDFKGMLIVSALNAVLWTLIISAIITFW
jgi:hypothetical protein